MVQIADLNSFLISYEAKINTILNLFKHEFGVKNPQAKWRHGLIPRTGTLKGDCEMNYSFHGAGCTVEYFDNEIVSFDFFEDTYSFDLFKFKLFIESNPSVRIDESDLDLILKNIELVKSENGYKIISKSSNT